MKLLDPIERHPMTGVSSAFGSFVSFVVN